MKPRVIVLNGLVGVGKTTVLNELKTHLPNCFVAYEYIDVLDNAEKYLNKYLKGVITAHGFQHYILDYYEDVANQLKDSDYDYILVERSPIEGIIFFAKQDLLNKRMTQYEYDELLERAKRMWFYPDIRTDNAITIKTDDMTTEQIAKLIITFINDFDINIFKLRAEAKTLKQRIQQRGRECEIKHYDDDYIQTMIENYV